MQKRKLFILVLSLFLISSVSAYSLGDLLGDIESSTMILGAIFVVSFAVLNFALSRFFKDKYGEPNKATAGIVSFVLALLMTWGINKTGFDIEGLLFDIGISSDLLYTVVPILILAGIALLIWKFGKKSLFIIGGLFILASFFVYEKVITLTIGVILLIIGIGLLFKKKPRVNNRYPSYTTSRPNKIRQILQNQKVSRRLKKPRTRSNITFSGPRQEWVTKEKAGNKLEEDYANIKQRQEREEVRRQARRDTKQQRREARIPVQQARQQKAQEKVQQRQQRREEKAEKLKQIQEQKTAQQAQVQEQQDRQRKNQKMITHLKQLWQKKDMELQKQQMMAAKGVTGAKQKIRTLEAELAEITRKMQRYQ